jgi:hypothetical protein
MQYATSAGPFHTWMRFCEEAFADERDEDARSNFMWVLVQVALSSGLPERTLAVAEEKRKIDLDRGAETEAAISAGFKADVLQARGDLDEALRIRREEELPVYERLGDVRAKAVTMGKIADVLAARGQLDEAVRIYREDVLPAYARIGEARMMVIDRGYLASYLLHRNEGGDREAARSLLCLALADARRMRLPAEWIPKILREYGLTCD